MSKSDHDVERLRAMCGLGLEKCRKALAGGGGEVDVALAALIDAGEVKTDDLDPDLVSDELFGRASHRETGGMFGRLTSPFAELMKNVPGAAGEEVNKKLAQLAAESKANLEKQAKDFKEVGARARNTARITRRIKSREAALKKAGALVLPPFPKLTPTLDEWTGNDVLKTWAGYGTDGPGKGKVEVTVPRGHNDDDAKPTPPAPEMVAAYAHLKGHEKQVTAAVLEAFRSYVNDRLIGEWEWELDPISDFKALKKMVEVQTVRVLPVAKDGMGYIGLFCQCTWDEEHAAGVLLHGSRVVDVGDHDTSMDVHAAIADGGAEINGWKY